MLPSASPPAFKLKPARFAETARWAEANGFDGVWIGDHIGHPQPLLESIVTLSFMAAVTSTIRVGTCVLLLALRKPAVIARQLATLAVLSGGRLTVGVGVGGAYPQEWAACGVPMHERGARTEEAVELLRALLDGRTIEAPGRFTDLTGFRVDPAPPVPVPVVFGGGSAAALRRAARLGDGWIGWLEDPESFGRSLATIRAALAGRAADHDFRAGMALPTLVTTGREAGAGQRAARLLGAATGNVKRFAASHMLAGTPTAIVDQIEAFAERGCLDVVLLPVAQEVDLQEQLALLAGEVVPALAR
jgi:alkanesulfonate monooxygenase SsuD/methylene tetrahydromethanopterin reductase-like flavin-dependent oxidoreductase (luciferase family)